ncbi:hypothetical protein J2S13_003091 [Oikeobacillus pervagus]|uniref:DUF2292 domain-containing protein n=1 Tax=Oikeobacillus pervagus TaxID=1325931 RepID=A0AAJ1WHV4_9BACI|nr:DUF2292 domain-containing protein [Oikeobacillus pervagus]MDQ0216617.1 hypothetical protein [Oikeobacillus pervagus]
MGNPSLKDTEKVNIILKALKGIEFGTIQITIHEGQIVQIDQTMKQRFPLEKK